jgi:DNA-directed RNA polymerase specialized sigma24 family protein
MVKPIPVLHLQRYVDAELAVKDALHRVFTGSGRSLQRTPFGLAVLQALHKRLLHESDTDLRSFVCYTAPLIRGIAMQAAERQAMIEPVKLSLVDLEQWLRRLDELDPDCVRVIELRYFCGLSIREVAWVLGISVAEILGLLRFAKAWLQARVRWSSNNSR